MEILLTLKDLFPDYEEKILKEIAEKSNQDLDSALDYMKNLETENTPPKTTTSPNGKEKESLCQLKEIFPEFPQEKLLSILKENDYDIEKSSESILLENENENSFEDLIPFKNSNNNNNNNQNNQTVFSEKNGNDIQDMYDAFDFFLEPNDDNFELNQDYRPQPLNEYLENFDNPQFLRSSNNFKSLQLANHLIQMDKELEERRLKREAEDLKFALQLQNEISNPLKLSQDEEFAKKLENEFKSEQLAKKLEISFNQEEESEKYAKKLQEEFQEEVNKKKKIEKENEDLAKKIYEEELHLLNQPKDDPMEIDLRNSEEHPLKQLDNIVFDKEQREMLRNEILEMIHTRLSKFNFQKILGQNNINIEKVMTENLARRFEDQFLAFKLQFNYNPKFTNVELAFHGTPAKNVNSILSKGLLVPETGLGKINKVSHTTDSGWYGKGIYLSPDPSYCFSYAHNSGKLLVCAVLLGKTYMCKNNNECRGKSCKDGYQSHKSPDGKEWVLFSAGQVYPCFVLSFGASSKKKQTWFH